MKTTLFLIPFLLVGAAVAQDAVNAGELVKQLGHDDYDVREKAMTQLIELGDKAVPELEKALASEDLEVRLRAGRALRAIRGNGGVKKPAEREKIEEKRPRPKAQFRPGSRTSGMKIEMLPGKVRVTVTETVDGKQVEKTYEGKSIEELKKKHPELAKRLGGFRFGVSRDPFDMEKFWKDWNKDFDEDFMRRWQEETRRDMDRMRRWMQRLQEERRGRPGVREPADRNVLGVRARRPEAVLDAQLELRGRGLVVDSVEKGSLAEALGLQRYDILMRLNGVAVRDFADVAKAMRGRESEQEHKALVLRRGKTVELKSDR